MKLVILVLSLLSSGVLFMFADDLKSSLDAVIDRSILPGELRKDLLEENFKAWPGYNTMDGVITFYNAWKQASDEYKSYTNNKDWNKLELTREENVICAKIPAYATMQKWLEAPRDEIVTYLIQRVEKSELNDLLRDMSFLSFYSDDPKALKCIASFLNDKRQFYETRGSKTFPSGRVCDTAQLILRKHLENEGVIKWGDPGIVWDSPSKEERDHNIEAIRVRLIERGIIRNDERISQQSRDTASRQTHNARTERRGTKTDSDPKMQDKPNDLIGSWNHFAWAAGVLIGIGLLWFSLVRLRARR